MIRTLTALFDSRADAERAQQRLTAIGIPAANVQIIDKTSAGETATADPHGFWDKLKHMFLPYEDRHVFEEGVRRGQTLLTAQVEQAQAEPAIDVLDECNAVDLQQRQAQWRQAGWSGVPAGSGAAREEVIPVAEERLRVGKREFNRGGVRVHSYIVEEPVQEEVALREEHVEVERRPVGQPAAPGAAEGLMQERTVEMRETAEEPVVQKDTRVKEEVVVRKRAEERTEQVSDTVRRTEVDVEDDSESGKLPRPPQAPRRTPEKPSRR